MGQKRKRNTTDSDGGERGTENNLTYSEMWDDSALIDSWNEAVEEYKHYHTLHRLGRTVMERILDENSDADSDALAAAFERAEDQTDADAEELGRQDQDDESLVKGEGALEEASAAEVVVNAAEDDGVPTADDTAKQRQQDREETEEGEVRDNISTQERKGLEGTANQPPFPENLLNTGPCGQGPGQGEAMKHLMMSWYWAGYYTGLHEGQRQAAGSSAANAKPAASGAAEHAKPNITPKE